jgi:putative ABC transport system permease protein
VQLGFDPSHVLTAEVSVRGARYDSLSAYDRFWEGLAAQLRATPGVISAGFVGGLPLEGSASAGLAVEGEPVDLTHLPEVGYLSVASEYFGAMRIPLRAGRLFDASDLPRGPRVVIINESLARRYFPRGDALGRRVRLGPDPKDPYETIVGVVGDVRQGGVAAEPRPTVYVDDRQEAWGTLALVVRTSGDPRASAPAVRAALRAIDPTLALTRVRTMDDVLDGSLVGRRFSLALIVAFAALALVVAAVGVYGVLAYTVATRRREFGIRLALGATAGSVLRLVLRQGALWLLLGLTLGAAASLAAAPLITHLLYGVRPADPVTFAAVALLLLGVVLAACLVPARRATRVDPAGAMRAE